MGQGLPFYGVGPIVAMHAYPHELAKYALRIMHGPEFLLYNIRICEDSGGHGVPPAQQKQKCHCATEGCNRRSMNTINTEGGTTVVVKCLA